MKYGSIRPTYKKSILEDGGEVTSKKVLTKNYPELKRTAEFSVVKKKRPIHISQWGRFLNH